MLRCFAFPLVLQYFYTCYFKMAFILYFCAEAEAEEQKKEPEKEKEKPSPSPGEIVDENKDNGNLFIEYERFLRMLHKLYRSYGHARLIKMVVVIYLFHKMILEISK